MRVLNIDMILDFVSGGGTAEGTFQMSRFLVKAGTECNVWGEPLSPDNSVSQLLHKSDVQRE
jgi:hypothetical protein